MMINELLCRYWSDPEVWKELEEPYLAYAMIDEATGLPGDYANVTVPSNWRIQLDVNTANLLHLELHGASSPYEHTRTELEVLDDKRSQSNCSRRVSSVRA